MSVRYAVGVTTLAILAVYGASARCRAEDETMAHIPAGPFSMGDHHGVGWKDERPVHTVTIRAFAMDRIEVSNAKMCEVMQWAFDNKHIFATQNTAFNLDGLREELLDLDDWNSEILFDDGVFSVRPGREDFPVVEVTWYGALAYGNFRSMREGLDPCIDFGDWRCDFSRNGYRLPTEAEWEKAARGGLKGHHYPWISPSPSYRDDLTGNRANYWGSGDPFETNEVTLSSPVGYYDGRQTPKGPRMENGYGLYDMGGNVWEWCWDYYVGDWYEQDAASVKDPTGPDVGVVRVFRGGSWLSGSKDAGKKRSKRSPGYYLRCANRSQIEPGNGRFNRGFRCVRRPAP